MNARPKTGAFRRGRDRKQAAAQIAAWLDEGGAGGEVER